MPTKNALRDVDPHAITIVKQGANRQRIFLRKSVADETLLELPGGVHPILKSADSDWTTFYCVVAEPGAEEDPGLVGEAGSVDVWESADEIRKAAHRLLKNAAYVNTTHDDPAVDGCAIVESAVALVDLPIGDAVIPEGSWYVGIEPTAELRKAVDDGEITGVSLEGSGVRVELEKAADKDNGNTHRTCGSCGAKMALTASTCPSCGAKYAVKKAASFGEVIGARELRDALWQATSTLEDVIYTALRDEDESDPKGVIRRSLDEFVEFLAPKLESVGADGRAALAKELSTLGTTTTTPEDEMGLAQDFEDLKKKHEEDLAEIKKSSDATTAAVEGLVGLTGKLVERVEALSGSGAGDGDDGKGKADVKKASTAEEAVTALGKIADRLDEFDRDLTGLAKSVATLAEGDSAQEREETTTTTVNKSKNPLAGLLD